MRRAQPGLASAARMLLGVAAVGALVWALAGYGAMCAAGWR